MKAQAFVRPTSLEEAYQILQESPKNKIVAGGLWLKKGNAEAQTLVDLSNLGLNKIEEKKEFIEVGALVTQREFEKSPVLARVGGGVLCEAVKQIMGPAFRNLATIGGSVYGKYGFSDVVTALLGFKVELVFYPKNVVLLEDYVSTPGFGKGILTHIRIYKSEVKAYFKKVAITALDYPILNVCVTKGKEYRIVVGSRPLVGKLALKAMKYLNEGGKDFKEAAKLALEELKVGDSIATKSAYREQLLLTYVERGLEEVK